MLNKPATTKKINSELLPILVISTLLFSSAAFYQTKWHELYINILSVISVLTGLRLFLKPSVFTNTFFKRPTSKYMLWIISLFLFFIIHAILYPRYKDFSINMFLIQFVVVLLVILWICDLNTSIKINILIYSCILAFLALLVYFMTVGSDLLLLSLLSETRLSNSLGLVRNTNYSAQYIFIFSIFTIYKAIISDKKFNLYYLIFLVQFFFILLTGSKRIIIAIVILLILMFYIKTRKKFYIYFIPLVLIVSLFVNALLKNTFLYNVAGQRIENMIKSSSNTDSDYSTEVRKDLFFKGIKMFQDKFILGHGFAYFETHSGLNTDAMTFHTHNNYLELLISYGIIGLILYYSLFVKTAYRLIKSKKNMLSYLFIFNLLIGLLLLDPTSVVFYTMPIYYLILYFAYIYSFEKIT